MIKISFFTLIIASTFFTLPMFVDAQNMSGSHYNLSMSNREGTTRTINYEDGTIEKQIKYSGRQWKTFEIYSQDSNGSWSWKKR